MITKVFLDITNFCNSNCVYCFTNSKKIDENSPNEILYSDIEKLIDDLVTLGVKDLSIGGGEPFLRNVCRILDYTNGKLDLSVTTNGTIINEAIINSLASNNVNITVSLDALDQNVSNLIRKGIDVKLVVNNIKKLLENPIVCKNLSIRTTVSKYNIENLIDMVDFCNNNSIKRLKVNSVNNFGRAKENAVTPDFNQFMKALDSIISYCEMNNISTKISLPIEKYLKDNDRKCTLGNASVYIDSFGNLYPCAFSEGNLCWGNITKRRFSDLLNKNWDHDNGICRNCPINRYKDHKAKTV